MPNAIKPPFRITHKAIKHLYLRIDAQGELQISAPKRMPEAEILAFVAKKRDWIAAKQLKHRKHSAQPNTFTLLGKAYAIERHLAKRNRLVICDTTCQLHLTDNNAALAQKVMTKYQRDTLMPYLQNFVRQYTPIIGAEPAEIRTKNMKTKWGSCNPRAKRLWFAVALAQYSEKCIEYVVVHEMVHLLEASHNQRFWQLVNAAMPDWQAHHLALKHA